MRVYTVSLTLQAILSIYSPSHMSDTTDAAVIWEWFGTLIENVRNLAGSRADPIQHQRVAYLVTRFSPMVKVRRPVSGWAEAAGHTVPQLLLVGRGLDRRDRHHPRQGHQPARLARSV